MHRRTVLTVCGTALATHPGCLSSGSDTPTAGGDDTATPTPSGSSDDPTPTPTETPGDDTPTPTDTPPEADLSVEFDALQPELVGLNVDAFKMITGADTQYHYLDVSVESGIPPALSDSPSGSTAGNTPLERPTRIPPSTVCSKGTPTR